MTNSIIQDIEKQIDDLHAEQKYQEQRLKSAIEAGKTHVYEVGYSHSWMEYTSIANSERSARERISEIDCEIRDLYDKLWLENQKLSNVQ
jgi:hypothetical protein